MIMKNSILILFLVVLVSKVVAQDTLNPVDIHGRLQVNGASITSSIHGEPVQLRGMSLFWSQWNDGARFYNEGALHTLVDDWKINVIRIAMAASVDVGGYIQNTTTEKNKVIRMVDAAIAEGIYVIIDWHSHEAHLEEEEAKAFFAEMAQLYGDKPNVIYELYNEPLKISWNDDIKPYCEAVIDSIRVHDVDNLIICGTPNWSQDVIDVVGNEISDINVAYTLHYYAASHGDWLRNSALSAINQGVPLVVTEFGTTEASGNGTIDEIESNIWWDFLDEHNISWCNWSVSNKDEAASILIPSSSSLGDWGLDDYTESGLMVRNELRTHYELPVYDNDLSIIANFDSPLIHMDSVYYFDFTLMSNETVIPDSLVTYTIEASNGGVVSEAGLYNPNGDLGQFKLFVTAKYDTLISTNTFDFTVTDVPAGEISSIDELKMLALFSEGVYKHNNSFNVLSSLLTASPKEGDLLKGYTWGEVSNENQSFAGGDSYVKSVFAVYIISPIDQLVKLNYDMAGSVNDLLNGKPITSELVSLNRGDNLFLVEYTSLASESSFWFDLTSTSGDSLSNISYSLSSSSIYDCAGDWAGKAVLTSECGCVGGSTGVLECPGPFNGSPVLLPGIVESEEYDKGGENIGYYDDSNGNEGAFNNRPVDDVDKETSGDTEHFSGDGNVGWISQGEWLKYTVDVTQTNKYLIDFRVASANSYGQFDLEIDGKTILKNKIAVSSTGGWSSWETVRSDTVVLTKGVQEIYFKALNGGANITYMQFHLANAVGLSDSEELNSNVYPNPFTSSFTVDEGNYDSFVMYNSMGNVIERGTLDGQIQIGQGLNKGFYLLELRSNSKSKTIRVVKN